MDPHSMPETPAFLPARPDTDRNGRAVAPSARASAAALGARCPAARRRRPIDATVPAFSGSLEEERPEFRT